MHSEGSFAVKVDAIYALGFRQTTRQYKSLPWRQDNSPRDNSPKKGKNKKGKNLT